MYVEDNLCQPPDDLGAPLWRYMTLSKLLHLLKTSRAFFCRADKLEDPFEGSWPVRNIEARVAWFKTQGIPAENHAAIATFIRDQVSQAALWCWHQSEHESAAMWRGYLKSDEGVAVRSTFGRLRDSLTDAREKVRISVVRYLDFDRDLIDLPGGEFNVIASFVHKRKSYEYERELRAMVWYPGEDHLSPRQKGERGLLIPVHLDALVEAIYVAPSAPTWFAELTEDLVHHLGLTAPVRQSDMLRSPLY
jgi:hypothetical protein